MHHFGCSVAISGDYAIVGAYGNDNKRGSAYIFKRDGTSWTRQARLNSSSAVEHDLFGGSVSIDGDYAIVGASCDDQDVDREPLIESGSAYIFKRNATEWTEQAKLTASDGTSNSHFGCSVALDGDYAFVGADGDNENGRRSGAIYVFRRIGSTWIP